jgi:UDP-N-acetylglucosamine 3-dehydrogenase
MTKAAVIGVGSMGFNHTRVYAELPGVELVGVSDTNLERAKFVADKFGTQAYNDHRELLEKTKPEVVSITVPTSLHEAVATDVLQSGAHVLVEKPITATLEEGKRLIAFAKKMERKLMVGHIIRFNPAIRALKDQLEADKLGRIIQIFCRRAGPFPARIRDVGVVVDLAPHDLDIMRFITGLEPLRVYAETEQHIHTKHEDLLFALLRFPEGITGALEINWLTPTKLREVLVLGERGLFRVDDLLQDLYFYENSLANSELHTQLQNIKGVSEGSMTRFALNRIEPLKAELEAFITCVRENKPVPISGEDGLAALRLALALVESAQKHQVIEV